MIFVCVHMLNCHEMEYDTAYKLLPVKVWLVTPSLNPARRILATLRPRRLPFSRVNVHSRFSLTGHRLPVLPNRQRMPSLAPLDTGCRSLPAKADRSHCTRQRLTGHRPLSVAAWCPAGAAPFPWPPAKPDHPPASLVTQRSPTAWCRATASCPPTSRRSSRPTASGSTCCSPPSRTRRSPSRCGSHGARCCSQGSVTAVGCWRSLVSRGMWAWCCAASTVDNEED